MAQDRLVSDAGPALPQDAVVCDLTLPWFYPFMVDVDITLPRFHEAGIDFVSLTVNVPENSLAATVRHIAMVKAHIRSRADRMAFAASAEDILAAKASGRLAVGLHFQGTDALDGAVEMVQTYYDLGVRHMLLAYNRKNAVGDGCAERTDGGLSRFGLQLVAEMNRVGVLVDGSHTGYRTTMEAMEACRAPFIFSHSNAHALVPHYRNIRDDQIKACAKSGGLIGINGINEFLGVSTSTTEALFRHVDHICQLVGPQHAAIGLDYVKDAKAITQWVQDNPELWPANNGVPMPEPDDAQPEQVVELGKMMLARGYAEKDVRGVLGENFLRVLRAARAIAEELGGGKARLL